MTYKRIGNPFKIIKSLNKTQSIYNTRPYQLKPSLQRKVKTTEYSHLHPKRKRLRYNHCPENMSNNGPYGHREMRHFLARAIGQFTPQALIQLLDMDLGSYTNLFRELVWLLLNYHCTRFLRHARKWSANPNLNPLETMREYHMLWEGWACDEPYFNSQGKTIRYFMDRNYHKRLVEMDRQFIQ